MARYVIHIGYGKTGTTALQTFLAANRASLRKHGIVYPEFRRDGVALGIDNHNALGFALDDAGGWPRGCVPGRGVRATALRLSLPVEVTGSFRGDCH